MDADLAEVMEQARVAQLLELVLVERPVAELADRDVVDRLGDARRELFDAARMTGRDRISLLDCGDARCHEAFEHVLDLVEQVFVVERDGGLAGDGLEHLEVLGPETNNLLLDGFDGQLRLELSLRVDELDGAHQRVVVVAHRHSEHRLGAIAVLSVEALAALRLAGWRVVSIVVDLARAHRHRVTDDALLVDWNLECLVGVSVDRVVLARGKEETGLAVGLDLLQPQARPVGVGELPHRREDEVLQLGDIPLGRERDADAVELLELPVLPPRLLLELLDLAAEASAGGRIVASSMPSVAASPGVRMITAGDSTDSGAPSGLPSSPSSASTDVKRPFSIPGPR